MYPMTVGTPAPDRRHPFPVTYSHSSIPIHLLPFTYSHSMVPGGFDVMS